MHHTHNQGEESQQNQPAQHASALESLAASERGDEFRLGLLKGGRQCRWLWRLGGPFTGLFQLFAES